MATSDDTANVVGRFNSNNPSLAYGQFKVDDTSGIWTSGWVDVLDIEQGIFDIDILLQKNTLNNFIISVRSNSGEILKVLDDSFQIKHQEEVLITSAPPIPHSLSVEINSDGKEFLKA